MERTRTANAHGEPPGDIDLGLVDALAQLSFLISGTLAKAGVGHDLSMAQARLLGILRDRTPSMHELARLLELDKSSVTGLVDRAEKRGFVVRTLSPEDRRAFRVSLTELGRAIIALVLIEFQAHITDLSRCLSVAEQKMLSVLASRVIVTYVADRGVDLLDLSH